MNGLYDVDDDEDDDEDEEEDEPEEEDVETTDEVLEGIQKIIQKSCPRQGNGNGPQPYKRNTEKSTTILVGIILVFVICHVLRLRCVLLKQ